MSYLVPLDKSRFQAVVFVGKSELAALSSEEIIQYESEKIANRMFQKILEKFIEERQGYAGFDGTTLHLDVYVLKADDLLKLLGDARKQGEYDAARWIHRNG